MNKFLTAILSLPLIAGGSDAIVGGSAWSYESRGDAAVTITRAPSVVGAIVVPSSLDGKPVTGIGEEAFIRCGKITSVTIPLGVTCIGKMAFACCSGLKSVTIPSSVTNIGVVAFAGCSGLTSFSVDEANPSYCSRAGMVLSKDGTILVVGVNGDVTIPSGVTCIAAGAFAGCSGLTSVTIPSSVVTIERSAFSVCTGLKSLTIPPSVTSVGDFVFNDCFGLTSVTIPSSLTRVEAGMFLGCSGLTSVTIQQGVTSIGEKAFLGCGELVSVTIPSSVTNIESLAFRDCKSLVDIDIRGTNVVIDQSAFLGDTPVRTKMPDLSRPIGPIHVNVETPKPVADGATTIDVKWRYMGFGGGVFLMNAQNSPDSDSKRVSGDLVIPETIDGMPVRSIDFVPYLNCDGLTSVTIPSGVTNIGWNALAHCTGVRSFTVAADCPSYCSRNGLLCTKDGTTLVRGVSGDVVVPPGVVRIEDGAFAKCSGLTSVTIPSSVASVGENAFSSCGGLTSFKVAADNPSYSSRNGLLCSKDGTTLLAGVNGEVTIPSSVTNIAEYAFYGCGGLKSMSIPSHVTSIGVGAFDCCSGLVSFVVAATNPSYSSRNGLLCSKDGSVLIHGVNGRVTIPPGVTSIKCQAFSGLRGLASVEIPLGVTNIEDGCFFNCSTLKSVRIPSGVTRIGRRMFIGCGDLVSVTVPSSVTKIDAGAFMGCEKLETVDVVKDGNVETVSIADFKKQWKLMYPRKGSPYRPLRLLGGGRSALRPGVRPSRAGRPFGRLRMNGVPRRRQPGNPAEKKATEEQQKKKAE